MSELQIPAAGRYCKRCNQTMVRSGRLRWRCLTCGITSPIDPYLESIAAGAPMLPGMPIAPEPERRFVMHFEGHPLGPNDRVHWAERNRDAKRWYQAVADRVVIQRIPKLGRVRLSAVFYRRNLGVADADNDAARCKAPCDGLVRAGVLAGDSRKYVEWGEIREEHGPTGFALVIEALA